ncbi:MAG: NAD-dependent dihydropyrimidine dehydrogenase subunit PreA [Chloroflexi bacterium ADurb.Bin325]|nr:MAG: NAD-dependent dihydropyrimidine dehydrogenase subunit PreA [Chloroflexi bacterium ADurb.Bin325]
MVDLTTTYMGLTLKNPIVPSASPLSKSVSDIVRLAENGAAAVTMYSLFEEQIDMEALAQHHFLEQGSYSYAEALTYFPQTIEYNRGPEEYLDLIRQAKAAVDIPIIASLNGVTPGGWIGYARMMEQAGADAIECNVYLIPTRLDQDAAAIENIYLEVLKAVKATVKVPVAMKLSPFFSSLPNMAYRLDRAGADALVLFNRFYQPDLDIEELTVAPNLILSQSTELRLPLRWIAILYGHIKASLALTTGVHTAEDIVKAIMAGADVANVASVLLAQGVEKIPELLSGLQHWMEMHEYESVSQMKGALSQRSCPEPAAFERANYMKVLRSWSQTFLP